MPDSAPKAELELEDLAFHEGVAVLLRRALETLAPGELLEVRGDSADFVGYLQAWCRKESHVYHGAGKAPRRHLIERGAAVRTVVRPGREVAEVAEPTWGLAPRGAAVELGGPEFSFPLRKKRDVWGQELHTIYSKAVSNQWSAAKDISWSQLPKLPSEVEGAVCQVMTFLTENEFAALYVPARFLARIHPHYREVSAVLAMQVADEARHAEAFTRRAEEGGLGLGTTATSGQLSLQTLIEEPDFSTAVFLLCVMGEGTFLTLLKFLEERAPDPVTAALARYAHRDEGRHVAFGMEHIRYVTGIEPGRRETFAAAVERRGQMLASVSGLSPYVHDALVIYSGGGVSPAQIRRGASFVAGLHREMDRVRRERLQTLGFSAQDAEALSAYHTKNFM
jgi:TusA-related sulfurtransferase